jgi:hypothetical protein
MSLQDGAASLAGLPEWWPEATLWLGIGLLLAVVAATAAAWAAVRRLDRLRRELGTLESLQELQRSVAGWLAERDDLDLRRIEHLLIDLRDGSKRVEELLLRVHADNAVTSEALVPLGAPGAGERGLGERVVNRLLALGYERIELVTPHQELEAIGRGDGEVRVEARREGVLCKGRVRVRAGRIDSVQLQQAFSIFP